MRAILKNVDCMHKDFVTYAGEDDGTIAITLSLSIGPEFENGSEYFDLFICSPEWLCKYQWTSELMRNTLLVRKYDLGEIRNIVEKYIDRCQGDSWDDIAKKLSRFFSWEYETS